MELNQSAVVFDMGSSSTKVALSHEDTPLTFPTIVSKLDDEIYIGSNVTTGIKKRVVDGLVADWNYMQKIWDYSFNLLQVNPENHPIILCKTDTVFMCEKQKAAQILFEDFNIPALHVNSSAVLSLYGLGLLTGLVVDSGFSKTQFSAVYEGHLLERSLTRGLPVAGDYITCFLLTYLRNKGIQCDYDSANKIKEKYFFVSEDVTSQIVTTEEIHLPDGQTTFLANEKFMIPEELYKSSIEWAGIEKCVIHSLSYCDPELRSVLFNNIVLSGGNTLLPGFAKRLEKELLKSRTEFKFAENLRPKIAEVKNQETLAWIGGTKLGSLSTFPDMCMTKDEYNEYGPSLVNTKFF